jgi:enoyl-CoA hydratase
VGEKLALELALTGDAIAVERLERAGLVSRVVPAADVEREALDLATRIGANGPLAVRASYRIIREARDAGTDGAWALSMSIGLPVFASADAHEGATAFVEKRPPVWKGR